ncbi:MAG: carbohydrate kinase family protein [Desulfomonile sp.]|nr:carbohydrate kinase family protein [Desulfomonile sp.]
MKIFVSGSLAYDRIMDFPEKFSDYILPDKIHVLNVCFLVNGVTEQFGGTAGNIAYNLALLGERPIILASAGKDFQSYENWLTSHGLPLDGIRRIPDEFTAGAYITTDQADNQITGFNPGAMKHPCLYPVDGVDPSTALGIVAPGNVEDMETLCRQYRERGIPYIFDPGQQIPAIPTDSLVEMLTGSRILISNDYELEMIMRSTGMSRPDLLNRTGTVITTLGDRGSLVCTSEGESAIPVAKAAQVLDPTGAGDAFRAGLIKGLAVGVDLEVCARMGAVAASFSVECRGTQCHRFSHEQFKQRYEAEFGPLCAWWN